MELLHHPVDSQMDSRNENFPSLGNLERWIEREGSANEREGGVDVEVERKMGLMALNREGFERMIDERMQ